MSNAIPAELLEQSVNDIDTSRPRLAAGVMELEIVEAKVEPNKAGDKDNLNLQLKTISDQTTTEGDREPAGFYLFHTISLTPTEKYTAKRITDAIAQVCQSARVNGKLGDVLKDVAILKGRTVVAKVGLQKETDEYPERNTIKDFIVKK